MNVLIFAPHRDDEILGVGGTILKLKAAGHHVTVCIVTARQGEQLPPRTAVLHQEMLQAHAFCGIDACIGLPWHSTELERVPRRQLTQSFLDVVRQVAPEEVYLPFQGDMQIDHRVTSDTALVVLREKYDHPVRRIYAYETLSETGLGLPTPEFAFIPNVFVDITEQLEGKKKALSFFTTQTHPFPDLRSLQAVEALARFRGATVNVPAAEAFMLIRETK